MLDNKTLKDDKKFPKLSIDECLIKLKDLYEAYREHSFSNNEICQTLKITNGTGYSNRIIASFKCYGMLDVIGNKIKISQCALHVFVTKKLMVKHIDRFIQSVPMYQMLKIKNEYDLNHSYRDLKGVLKIKYKYTAQQLDDFIKMTEKNLDIYKRVKFVDTQMMKIPTEQKTEKPKLEIKNEKPEITLKKETEDLVKHIVFPIGDNKNIEFKYPEDINNEEIEMMLIALEFVRKRITSKK
jgi:hypothetical protein